MTDYTKQCPCCDIGQPHAFDDHGENYECERCTSVWCISSDRSDYVVLSDNSDTLTTRNLNDPYKYHRFHRC